MLFAKPFFPPEVDVCFVNVAGFEGIFDGVDGALLGVAFDGLFAELAAIPEDAAQFKEGAVVDELFAWIFELFPSLQKRMILDPIFPAPSWGCFANCSLSKNALLSYRLHFFSDSHA